MIDFDRCVTSCSRGRRRGGRRAWGSGPGAQRGQSGERGRGNGRARGRGRANERGRARGRGAGVLHVQIHESGTVLLLVEDPII